MGVSSFEAVCTTLTGNVRCFYINTDQQMVLIFPFSIVLGSYSYAGCIPYVYRYSYAVYIWGQSIVIQPGSVLGSGSWVSGGRLPRAKVFSQCQRNGTIVRVLLAVIFVTFHTHQTATAAPGTPKTNHNGPLVLSSTCIGQYRMERSGPFMRR